MARTKKTVDYFPHIIKNGKTITILENKFGNDGYAFWFKLLEILGSTEGHYYEYKDTSEREFLHARTGVSEEDAQQILDLLADLGAIDKELWKENIIWSDNFIDNIRDAYSRRKVNVPHKPTVNHEDVNIKGESSGTMGDKKQQSKVKESKVNNTNNNGGKFDLTKKENGRYEYPEGFEEIWKEYPKSRGTKKKAWRKWRARRNEGVDNELLLEATKNYKIEVEHEGTEKKYVKHGATFFGPDEHWREYLDDNWNDPRPDKRPPKSYAPQIEDLTARGMSKEDAKKKREAWLERNGY
jgi:hypothetical protein